MKRAGMVATVVFALLAFACGFGGVTAGIWVTQPLAPHDQTQVPFIVRSGDSASDVADNLQKLGLIHNALLFRGLARYRNVGSGFQKGVYQLSPNMSMDQIIHTLRAGTQQVTINVTIPPGKRIAEYPAFFKVLPGFNAANFLQIAKTGKFLDGTAISSQYWYVEPLQPKAVAALEGYLFPDTYNVSVEDTEKEIVIDLLGAFGEKLCPGPDIQHHDAYIFDKAMCKAHAVSIGGTSIFTLLEQKYFTTDDTLAVYRALTIASIVMREVSHSPPDIQKVTNVLYNRYLVFLGKLPEPSAQDVVKNLGADPTAQYARDTDTPPSNGTYWQALNGVAKDTDPSNPYNTNNVANAGLPPGPISAPFNSVKTLLTTLYDAANPNPSGPTPSFYYWASCQGNVNTIYYAATYQDAQTQQAQHPPTTC